MLPFEGLVNHIIHDHFANRDFAFGDAVISTTMNEWAKSISSGQAGQGLTFEFTYMAKYDPGISQTYNIDALVMYQGDTHAKNVLLGLASEWIHRCNQHFDQVKEIAVERFGAPKQDEPATALTTAREKAQQRLIEILRTLTLDEGLDFMMCVTVEWARRFANVDKFIENTQRGGYALPESVNLSDYAAGAAIWFLATGFHCEHI